MCDVLEFENYQLIKILKLQNFDFKFHENQSVIMLLEQMLNQMKNWHIFTFPPRKHSMGIRISRSDENIDFNKQIPSWSEFQKKEERKNCLKTLKKSFIWQFGKERKLQLFRHWTTEWRMTTTLSSLILEHFKRKFEVNEGTESSSEMI
jgi:hypothetical protein